MPTGINSENQAREMITTALIEAVPNAERSDRLKAEINGLATKVLEAINSALTRRIEIKNSFPTIENQALRSISFRQTDIAPIRDKIRELLQKQEFQNIFRFESKESSNFETADQLSGLIRIAEEQAKQLREESIDLPLEVLTKITFARNLTEGQQPKNTNEFTQLGKTVFVNCWDAFKKAGILAEYQRHLLIKLRSEIIAHLLMNPEPNVKILQSKIPEVTEANIQSTLEHIMANDSIRSFLKAFHQAFSPTPLTPTTPGGAAPDLVEVSG